MNLAEEWETDRIDDRTGLLMYEINDAEGEATSPKNLCDSTYQSFHCRLRVVNRQWLTTPQWSDQIEGEARFKKKLQNSYYN